MNECPFCATQNTGDSSKGPSASPAEDDKTQVMPSSGAKAGQSATTPMPGNEPATKVVTSSASQADADDRTMIHRPDAQTTDSAPVNRRRLTGILVTYTMDPSGIDYKLYEGENTLGRDAGNDIVLISDPKISGQHARIFFRDGETVFSDEFSSNPSYVNGDKVALGQRVPLADGDVLHLGDHSFLFRTLLSPK